MNTARNTIAWILLILVCEAAILGVMVLLGGCGCQQTVTEVEEPEYHDTTVIEGTLSYKVPYASNGTEYLYAEFGAEVYKFAVPYPDMTVGWTYRIEAWYEYPYWNITGWKVLDS